MMTEEEMLAAREKSAKEIDAYLKKKKAKEQRKDKIDRFEISRRVLKKVDTLLKRVGIGGYNDRLAVVDEVVINYLRELKGVAVNGGEVVYKGFGKFYSMKGLLRFISSEK